MNQRPVDGMEPSQPRVVSPAIRYEFADEIRQVQKALKTTDISVAEQIIAQICSLVSERGNPYDVAELCVALIDAARNSLAVLPHSIHRLHWGERAWAEFILNGCENVAREVMDTLRDAVDINQVFLERKQSQALGEASPQEPSAVQQTIPFHHTVLKVKDIIHQEFARDLNVADIAERVYLSPNYLSRLFKADTGQTITEYTTHVRLHHAKRLLRGNQNLKTYEVSDLVGYPDPVYFHKLFKRIVGVTPRQYRSRY